MAVVVNTSTGQKLPLSVDAWKLYTDNDIELVQLELKKGESIEKHINTIDVFFVILAGEVVFETDLEVIPLKENEVLFVEKNIPRACKNIHSKTVKILVIKKCNIYT